MVEEAAERSPVPVPRCRFLEMRTPVENGSTRRLKKAGRKR
jgi:hypothetical protein